MSTIKSSLSEEDSRFTLKMEEKVMSNKQI